LRLKRDEPLSSLALSFNLRHYIAGAPVMISGKVQGGLPRFVELKGFLADGTVW